MRRVITGLSLTVVGCALTINALLPVDASVEHNACGFEIFAAVEELGAELRVYEDVSASWISGPPELRAIVDAVNELPDDMRMQEGCAS
jgi:hypothetical protein